MLPARWDTPIACTGAADRSGADGWERCTTTSAREGRAGLTA